MTVKGWNLMNAEIPRLQYEQMYADYIVAMAAQGGEAGFKLAETWRRVAEEGIRVVASTKIVDDFWERYSMAQAFATVNGSFTMVGGNIVDGGGYSSN